MIFSEAQSWFGFSSVTVTTSYEIFLGNWCVLLLKCSTSSQFKAFETHFCAHDVQYSELLLLKQVLLCVSGPSCCRQRRWAAKGTEKRPVGAGHSHRGVEKCNWELESLLADSSSPSSFLSLSSSSLSPSSSSSFVASSCLMKMFLMQISSSFSTSSSSSASERRKSWTWDTAQWRRQQRLFEELPAVLQSYLHFALAGQDLQGLEVRQPLVVIKQNAVVSCGHAHWLVGQTHSLLLFRFLQHLEGNGWKWSDSALIYDVFGHWIFQFHSLLQTSSFVVRVCLPGWVKWSSAWAAWSAWSLGHPQRRQSSSSCRWTPKRPDRRWSLTCPLTGRIKEVQSKVWCTGWI